MPKNVEGTAVALSSTPPESPQNVSSGTPSAAMRAADLMATHAARTAADPSKFSLNECLTPAISIYDMERLESALPSPYILPASGSRSAGRQYIDAWLSPDYMPAALGIDDQYGWWNRPPLFPVLPERQGMAPEVLPSGLIPGEDIYPAHRGTEVRTPRAEFAEFIAAPARTPPEYFVNEFAERPAFLKYAEPRLFNQFMNGVQMKFEGMAAAHLTTGPPELYLPEHEHEAAKEMITAYRGLYTPDFGKFVVNTITLESYGPCTVIQNPDNGGKCVGFLFGEPSPDMPVRVHSRCLFGDALGSVDCDCGPQLHLSLEKFSKEGGLLIYQDDGDEGRGSGLVAKCCGLLDNELHDSDTYDAYRKLGLLPDSRTYVQAVEMLDYIDYRLGGKLKEVKLESSSPWKAAWIRAGGYGCTTKPVEPKVIIPRKYLTAKLEKMLYDLSRELLSEYEREQLEATEEEARILARASGRHTPLRPGEKRPPLAQVTGTARRAGDPPPEIGVIGNSGIDIRAFLRGDGRKIVKDPGGKALTMAAALEELDCKAMLVSRIPAGNSGAYLLDHMAQHGIDTGHVTEVWPEWALQVLTRTENNKTEEVRDFPYGGMPSPRNVRMADDSRMEAYVTSTDVPPQTLQELAERFRDRLLVSRIVARKGLLRKLGPHIAAFDAVTMTRDDAAVLLGSHPSRLRGMSNERMAGLVRKVHDFRAVFVADAALGIGSASDQGEFSVAAPRAEIRWGTAGAMSVMTAAVTAALLQGAGDVHFATQVAGRAVVPVLKRRDSALSAALPAPEDVGLPRNRRRTKRRSRVSPPSKV